jgi:hypothetical protein
MTGEYPLTLRQADQARSDFAAIESDLQFIMSQANTIRGLLKTFGREQRCWVHDRQHP